MKWIALLVLAAAIAAGAWWWFKRDAGDAAVSYATAKADRGDITVTVSASGTINPVTNVQVGSQVSGRIQALFADFNSVVTAGQVVAVLEQSPFLTRVRQAAATLAKAKANATLAKANYQREKTLAAQNIVSSAELDTAQATCQQAEAEQMQADAALETAQIDMQHATIYSPVEGVVLTRAVDAGQTVAASLQAPTLFTIASDLSKMQIVAKVDEADVGQVGDGQQVLFTVDAFPQHSFTGFVCQVRNSPQVVQNVVSYDTIIAVDNSSMKLRPGMTANTTIVVTNLVGVVRVPNAALRFKPPATVKKNGQGPTESRRNGESRASSGGSGSGQGNGGQAAGRERRGDKAMRQTLYVLVNDEVKSIRVIPGLTDGSYTEISSGLEPDADVVIGAASGKPTAQSSAQVNPFVPQMPRGGGRR